MGPRPGPPLKNRSKSIDVNLKLHRCEPQTLKNLLIITTFTEIGETQNPQKPENIRTCKDFSWGRSGGIRPTTRKTLKFRRCEPQTLKNLLKITTFTKIGEMQNPKNPENIRTCKDFSWG